MYAKMRGWRHDYRHHIQTMKVHAAHGELNEISAYLDMLDDDLTNVETVVKTGNRMADAVLNSKLSLAAEREIKVKAKAEITVNFRIIFLHNLFFKCSNPFFNPFFKQHASPHFYNTNQGGNSSETVDLRT